MLQTQASKAALALAGGVLAATMAASPALATALTSATPPTTTLPADSAESVEPQGHPKYRGKVLAKPALNVRDRAGMKGKVIGSVPYGKVIKIYCKLNSTPVHHNPRWYKIKFKDRRGWVAAHYVRNLPEHHPKIPKSCHHPH